MAKEEKWIPPTIDGRPRPGNTYRAYESRYMTKEAAAISFKRKYGVNPLEVFVGAPNGTLIYAGPVPGMADDTHIKQLSFLSEKETIDNGNHNKSI